VSFLPDKERGNPRVQLDCSCFISYELLKYQNTRFSDQFVNVLFAKLRQQICVASKYSRHEVSVSVGGSSSEELSVP